ncbi:hypothetical protein L0Y69_01085 [bacterium]|nr:hypothetical protein [bacterium]
MNENIDILQAVRNGLNGRTGIVEVGNEEVLYNLPHLLQELQRNESERVILLEIMDLPLLSTSTNVLVSILVRIESLLFEIHCGRTTGLEEDALQLLQRLQVSTAIGFNGNLRERAGHLDPDTYAVETHRAEQARLGVSETFNRTLAALASQFFGAIRPLFVQGIILPHNSGVPAQLRLFQSPLFLVLTAKSVLL